MSIARVASLAACCTALVLAATLSAMPQGGAVGGSVQIQQMPRDQPPPSQMPRRVGTASIKGRVLDSGTGMPVARARVRVMGSVQPKMAITDAQGRFTFTELPAGPFNLSVEKSTYVTLSYPEGGRTIRGSFKPAILKDGEATEVTLRMYHGGVIAGRIVDSQGDLVENANVSAILLPRTRGGRPSSRSGSSSNDIGEFRLPRLEPGSYVLMVSPRGRTADDPSETQPIVTYYPGVASLEEAQPITLERGQLVPGVELILLEGMPSLVSGSVEDATGQPVTTGAYVNTRLVTKDLPGMWTSVSGASVKPDGTFQVKLTPGEYDFEVTATTPGIGSGPFQPGDQQVGTARVTVPAGPVSDVVIRLGRPGAVSGRFVFEGTSPPPKNPQQVNVGTTGNDGAMCRSGRAQTAADWTFRIEGVFGTCTLMSMGAPGGWTLKAMTRGNESLLDRPFTIQPGQELRNVVVVFTDKRTELTVKVTDDSGQPTSEYVALAFPVEKERWTTNSRYIQTYSPPPPEMQALMAQRLQGGRGAPGIGPTPMRRDGFLNLPPGEYYVVAVDDMEREQVRDPSVLAELASSATKVTLAEGSPVSVPLRVRKFMQQP